MILRAMPVMLLSTPINLIYTFKILMEYSLNYFSLNVHLHESQSALWNVQIFDIRLSIPAMRLIEMILKNIKDYASTQVNIDDISFFITIFVEKFTTSDPNSYVEADCMPFAEPTKNLNGLCVPDLSWMVENSEEAKVAAVFVDESISDLERTWRYLLGIILGSAILSLVITLCMRWLAGVSVWLCIFLFLGGTAGVLGFSGYKYSGKQSIKIINDK